MKFLFVLLILLFSSFIQAASFNCQKAGTQIERMICNDAELSKLDNELASAYIQDIDYSDDIQVVTEFQKSWLKSTRDICKNTACLKAAYQSRVSDLNAAIQSSKLSDNENSFAPDEEPEFAFRCDKHNQRLVISDTRFLPAIKQSIKSEVSESVIDEGSMIKYEGTEEHPLMLPGENLIAKCQLGKAIYMLEAKVVIYGSNPYGRDGATPPSISLTVKRNGKSLVSHLAVEDLDDGNRIRRITFNESTGIFRVLALLYSPKPRQIEKEFKIKSLPENLFQEIFNIPK